MSDRDAVVRIDPHVHSEGSYDGHEPVELVLEHAADIGLDGVVVTDHDAIEESLRAAAIADEYGLVGVPGVEVSTAVGHLLAIGVTECPPRGRPFDETVERIREDGGVAVVPHPFQRSRHGVRKRRIGDCDGIEVYNSMVFTGYRNRRARTFAARLDHPMLGASDAHSIRHVGRAYTEITLPSVDPETPASAIDASTVVEAVRAGDTDLRGRRTPIHRSARQYARGSLRKATYHLTAALPYVSPRPASMQNS
ncbi:PHP domain-containing protein [Halobaculum sp. CBA1158]|uniref:PHP domain-containing protein n=1 Tax=Halobaculum sp. CBA1158 TaxID=2904243 RepID=UPI001F25CA98|nr:PHP domain-containing protein [Halobaculum sp. CBA1158]UIP00384.1 PHP domain-containing protein [Halobaculum sp. CBA1158]